MTTKRKGRRYLATVAKGEAISLQGDQSDVKLEIKKGCPKGAYLMEVRTDLSNFGSFIPDDECFISPIVEVLAPTETNTSSYILWISHCLRDEDDLSKVKVRMIHENRNPAVVEVPVRAKCADGVLFYDIHSNFIKLHTPHFTKVACSTCQRYHCLDRINVEWYAKLIPQEIHPTGFLTFLDWLIGNKHRDVEIKCYICCDLHMMDEFQKVYIHRFKDVQILSFTDVGIIHQ